MATKKYIINGIIKLWNINDVILVENYKIKANSELQAKFLLAKELHKKFGYNQKMIYKRILASHLLIKK